MTAVGLIRALAAEVRDALKTYRFSSDGRSKKEFSVYEQYVPRAHMDDPEGHYHPLVAVICNSIEDDEQSTAEIDLTFGVYGESRIERDGRIEEPWVDLLNAMTAVRLRLLKKPVLNGRYRLLKPMMTELAEVQPAPFFYGLMTLRYWIYEPQEEGRMTR